jgi:hypothetical protein
MPGLREPHSLLVKRNSFGQAWRESSIQCAIYEKSRSFARRSTAAAVDCSAPLSRSCAAGCGPTLSSNLYRLPRSLRSQNPQPIFAVSCRRRDRPGVKSDISCCRRQAAIARRCATSIGANCRHANCELWKSVDAPTVATPLQSNSWSLDAGTPNVGGGRTADWVLRLLDAEDPELVERPNEHRGVYRYDLRKV